MPLSLVAAKHPFASNLSLNLLQNRLACTSQLSLKGVITTNLVVKFRAESGRSAQCQAHGLGSHSGTIAGFSPAS